MKEMVVISGKGGTGKTSVVAAFAALVENTVFADCDVDAPDLHLVLQPTVLERHEFKSGKTAFIDREACIGCDQCRIVCRFEAIGDDYQVSKINCEGCGACVHFCPVEAVELRENLSGQWFVSNTRFGPMVHARLGITEENSGRLVTLVRSRAKNLAVEGGKRLLIADGSPGIGCPVIASITGSDLVLVVTEPTRSGLHDMRRINELTRHFAVKTVVCINKSDINPGLASQIEEICIREGLEVVGRIPYDTDVTRAQVAGTSIIEYSEGMATQEIKKMWNRINNSIKSLDSKT
ncbi:MAG: 4Fe-4S binding protein [Firmicutes bacterium]|nr:4Fe-4S binding protein [Bacillota bacterium]